SAPTPRRTRRSTSSSFSRTTPTTTAPTSSSTPATRRSSSRATRPGTPRSWRTAKLSRRCCAPTTCRVPERGRGPPRAGLDPSRPDAHILYQDVGKVALGVESMTTWYRKKAAEKPDDPLFAFLADRLLSPEQALPAYEKLALQFPKSPWPHVGKARALETAS